MKPYSQKALWALERKVQKMEQAIFDLEMGQKTEREVAEEWRNYRYECDLCIVSRWWCPVCPLQECQDGDMGTFAMLHNAIRVSRKHGDGYGADLLERFRARLKWIMRKINKAGYELVEKKP